MSSIEEVFEDGNAFIPFAVGGYPDRETSRDIVEALVENGADIVELGIPFSDPMADGPVIKQAAQKALENDISVKDVLGIASEFPDTPVVIMSYANSIRSYGYERFFRDAEEAGVDGLIIPDMPPEEMKKELSTTPSTLLEKQKLETELDLIFLVSQNTPESRIEKIGEMSSGFVYLVSVKGTTGSRQSFAESSKKLVKKTSGMEIPRCIGFGVSSGEHSRQAVEAGADGVISGSALIEAYISGGLEELEKLSSELSRAVKGDRSG